MISRSDKAEKQMVEVETVINVKSWLTNGVAQNPNMFSKP